MPPPPPPLSPLGNCPHRLFHFSGKSVIPGWPSSPLGGGGHSAPIQHHPNSIDPAVTVCADGPQRVEPRRWRRGKREAGGYVERAWDTGQPRTPRLEVDPAGRRRRARPSAAGLAGITFSRTVWGLPGGRGPRMTRSGSSTRSRPTRTRCRRRGQLLLGRGVRGGARAVRRAASLARSGPG